MITKNCNTEVEPAENRPADWSLDELTPPRWGLGARSAGPLFGQRTANTLGRYAANGRYRFPGTS